MGKLKSGPKRKQGGAGAIGMGRSDLSNKGSGIISRKLPTVDEALRNRERASKKSEKLTFCLAPSHYEQEMLNRKNNFQNFSELLVTQ